MTIFATVQDGLIQSSRELWEVGETGLAGCQHKQPGLEPRGPGAKLGAPPFLGTAAPRFAPMPPTPAQLWGQGGDFRVWQIAHSAQQRLLKLSLNATAREKGRDSGNPRVSGSECSSTPLPIPGDRHCPSLVSAAEGAQGL